jgi:protein phosphatase
MAIQQIEDSFRRHAGLPVPERLRQAVADASAAVFAQAQAVPALKGMGTTCVMLVTDKAARQAWIAHIGDSRCYRLSAVGDFAQMTNDHSRVQEMLDAGWITKDEAAKSEVKNVITRAIGIERTAAADVTGPHLVRDGDRYLLCSDGLTDMMSDKDIAHHLASYRKPQAAAGRLVDLANLRGGFDNITVCIAACGKRKPKYPKAFIRAAGGVHDTFEEGIPAVRGKRLIVLGLMALLLLLLAWEGTALLKQKIVPPPPSTYVRDFLQRMRGSNKAIVPAPAATAKDRASGKTNLPPAATLHLQHPQTQQRMLCPKPTDPLDAHDPWQSHQKI